MIDQPTNFDDGDEDFSVVLVACCEALESANPPTEQELIARYPQFANELADYLSHRVQFDQLAAPLRSIAQAARDETALQDHKFTLNGNSAFGVGTEAKAFGDY